MVARLAALGALDAEGTVARGQPASLPPVLNCAFATRVTQRRKSCLVQEIVVGGFLRWSTVTKRVKLDGSVTAVSVTAGLEWRVFKSSCLPKKFRGEWSFGGLTYQVSGDPDGNGNITSSQYQKSESI